jgi:hypothetical protein
VHGLRGGAVLGLAATVFDVLTAEAAAKAPVSGLPGKVTAAADGWHREFPAQEVPDHSVGFNVMTLLCLTMCSSADGSRYGDR